MRNRASVVDALLAGAPPQVVGATKGRAASAELVVTGGFPGVLSLTPRQRVRYFRSYTETVLSRDLPEIGQVKLDRSRLGQLLRVLAARTSGLVNYSALGRDLGLDDKTIKAHIELLRQLFLLYRLAPWSVNLGARQVKTPKLMLADSGMAAALIGADAARYAAPDQGTLAGMLLETFVVMELVKQATWSSSAVELYFYRDTEKREVDVVIESLSGDVAAVETKAATSVTSTDVRGLELLRRKLGPRFKAGVVVYAGENTLRLSERIWAMPLPGLWH